jgi:hypothetical protein
VEARSRLDNVVSTLNEEQLRAYQIITDHATRQLEGHGAEQLLMAVFESWGTGKTTLIKAIIDSFTCHGMSEWLATMVTSEVASALFGGQTFHWWGGIPVKNEGAIKESTTPTGRVVENRRKANMLTKRYLIIDEISMMDSATFAKGSQIVSRVIQGDTDFCLCFGGLNMLIFGDFHQFSPPRNPRGALYSQSQRNEINVLGQAIYLQFNQVVLLQQQL